MINVDSNVHEGLLTAAQAARRLGVRKETLYAYVSRGLLRRYGGARSRGSFYAKSEIDRLAARRDARAGHAAVAAGALRWGEPVLDTELCFVDARGPAYRGVHAVDLVKGDVPFERVAELLWRGNLEASDPWPPPAPTTRGAFGPSTRRRALDSAEKLTVVALGVSLSEPRSAFPPSEETELVRARRLIGALASQGAPTPADATIAERAAGTLGVRPTRARVAAINAALVLLADHELNASAFAARVAASTGASLYDCILAALATAAGPRHGTASERVEGLVREIGDPRRARAVIEERARRGDDLPGFGHPLYPNGDPRARVLLDLASRLPSPSPRLRTVTAIATAVRTLGGPLPNVDLALGALSFALRAPGAGSFLFVLGRSAGWVAHALEQRRAGFLLRPRARYVGPVL